MRTLMLQEEDLKIEEGMKGLQMFLFVWMGCSFRS